MKFGPIWALFWPQKTFRSKTGLFGVPGCPGKARYRAKVCGNHDSIPVRPIGDSWNQIWALRALQVPLGLPKGPFGAKRGPFGGPGGQDRPDIRPKCMVTMIPTKSDQLVAVGTKFDPSWPSKDLWDPQKGLSGPKLAHLGALGAQKRPDTRPKCVVTMILTQSDQSAAVGTKSGPSGPSESLWGPQKGLSGPKRALLGPWSAVEVR